MIHDSLDHAALAIYAQSLDDLERQRIATDNRIRALCQVYGYDIELDADMPAMASLRAIADGVAALEHQATLTLQRSMRAHPLGPWVKATIGIGEKQAARLIAAVGDPSWNTLHDRPRTLGELWAYCGYHVIDGQAPKRAKGQKANWSNDAKMRAFLCAESCIKQSRSPYRAVYDATRTKYAEAVHEQPCVRCGPSGKPAQPGTPLSPGHQHARAMRAVAKAILDDLWHAANDLRTGQMTDAAQGCDAGADPSQQPTIPRAPTTLLPSAAAPSPDLGHAANADQVICAGVGNPSAPTGQASIADHAHGAGGGTSSEAA